MTDHVIFHGCRGAYVAGSGHFSNQAGWCQCDVRIASVLGARCL